MKKIYLSLFLIAATFAVAFSQVPNAFNYQAVVRNASGEIISSESVSFKISILKNSESGTVAYSETHTVTTNVFGLTNFEIGNGENTTGTFTPEGWGAAPHFVKVEFDSNGGSTFSHLATSKLTSVPYAFHAQTVANDQVDDADADPANEIQTLSLNGTLLELSNGGGSVTLPISGGGGDNWGAQTVKTNSTLTGNGTTATPLAVVADGDGDDSNELQTLSLSGSNLSLSDGGGTVSLPASPWSESSLEVSYRGTKSVYIGESSGSSAQTKSTQISDPAKLKVSVDNIPALEVYSESSTYSAVDIWNEEGVAARFGGNSDKPVAIFDNADVGLSAQFKDKIQIEDGTQGDGKVLTSDASGNASWQTPSAGGSSAWTESGSNVYRASGNVGIGTTTPSFTLDIHSASENAGLQLISTETSYIKLNRVDGKYAGINFVTDNSYNSSKSFRVGLLNDNNFSIVSGINKGLKIDGVGDVSLTSNLTVDGDLFVNQNLDVADDLSVGSVTIAGSEINKTSTGTANMMPVAYGNINSAGVINTSSENIVVSKTGTGKYAITIENESYYYTNYISVVTMVNGTGFVKTGSTNNNLLVSTYDTEGALKDTQFSFVVYKP